MDYLTIFLLILENRFGCLRISAEATASADFLLEKISTQETSENSDLTFRIHTNFFITTLSKDFQNGEEPFPHSSPTIIPKADRGVKTNLHLFRKYSKLFECGFSAMSSAPLLRWNFVAISVLGLSVTNRSNWCSSIILRASRSMVRPIPRLSDHTVYATTIDPISQDNNCSSVSGTLLRYAMQRKASSFR